MLKTTARYSECLETLLTELQADKVLYEDFKDDYQGYVEVDVLLKDGRVFSYRYSYGSCSGCDEWEDRGLTDEEIVQQMKIEATFFNNLSDYNAFLEKVPENYNGF